MTSLPAQPLALLEPSGTPSGIQGLPRPPARTQTLQELARICRAGRLDYLKPAGQATGFRALDEVLPGGGWPVGALTELIHGTHGIGELRILLPCLAELTRLGQYVAWIDPPYQPYPPALLQHGVRLEKVVIIRTEADARDIVIQGIGIQQPRAPEARREIPASAPAAKKRLPPRIAFWAAEQILRCPAFGAMLLWPQTPTDKTLRRLQLAAEAGRNLALLYRPANAAALPSPAALRLQLQGAGDELHIRVHKCRGLRAGVAVRCTFDKGLTPPSMEWDATVAAS